MASVNVGLIANADRVSNTNPLPVKMLDANLNQLDFSGINQRYRLLSSAASVNAVSVSAVPARLSLLKGFNLAAYPIWLHVYNIATLPTVGTSIPYLTFRLPFMSEFEENVPEGIKFDTGIGIGFTTGQADNSSVAIAAGDIVDFLALYSITT
jgi:hypothetical protein